jgi:hypothetical protein
MEPVSATGRSAVRPADHRSILCTFDRLFAVRSVICRSTGQTDRPAGPIRSDLFRLVPVPVVKKPDRFHLWVTPLNIAKICTYTLSFQDLDKILLTRCSTRVLTYEIKPVIMWKIRWIARHFYILCDENIVWIQRKMIETMSITFNTCVLYVITTIVFTFLFRKYNLCLRII